MVCLSRLNVLAIDAILFVIDENGKLIGSLTDGDVRRGVLSGLSLEDEVDKFIQSDPRLIQRGNYTIQQIIEFRDNGYKVLPIINAEGIVVNIINFRFLKSYLPIDALIMAGGRGERLRPLTDHCPKPLLKVGEKSIIQHNIDRLISYGIDDFWISVRYLGDQIKEKIGNGSKEGIKINYIEEADALGTIGALSLIPQFEHDYVMVTNSDVLTNLDYEIFFLDFIASDADFAIATIPYNVNVPYAILETTDNVITNFHEKPIYTYFANAGIYLMKREICDKVPKNSFFDATDLLSLLIREKYKVVSFPLRGYWMDIGKHEDYKKAQEDFSYIKF